MQHFENNKIKKILPILIVILSIIFSKKSLAQEPELIIPDTIGFYSSKIITLNEIHGVSNIGILKRLLVNKLIEKNNLTDIVMEIGKSSAYLLNEYIVTGDSSLLTGYIYFTYGNNAKAFWNELRRYYLMGIKIKIHGIDFERGEFVPALKMILLKQGKSESKLFKYLLSLPDSVFKLTSSNTKDERINILTNCQSIYNDNKSYYDAGISDSGVIKSILDNPVSEKKMFRRFRAMEDEFTMLYQNDGHSYLLIVGSFHVENSHPIYKKISNNNNISNDYICVISMIAKSCTVYAYGAPPYKIDLVSNQSFRRADSFIDNLFTNYSNTCNYNMIKLDNQIISKYNINNKYNIDYVIPVDCNYSEQNCGK